MVSLALDSAHLATEGERWWLDFGFRVWGQQGAYSKARVYGCRCSGQNSSESHGIDRVLHWQLKYLGSRVSDALGKRVWVL